MQTPSRSEDAPLIWERREAGGRAPLAPLQRDRVVRTAIALADDEGLAAVSVRRVAAALDVGPMRLYRVFATVDELTELMVDAVHGEMVDAATSGDWRARTLAILDRTRVVALRHEWIVDLLGSRPHLGPNGLAWLESLTGALADSPAVQGPGTGWIALGTVNGFLYGALRREVAERRAGRTGEGVEDLQRRSGPYIGRMLDTGRFPVLRGLILAPDRPDPDAVFHAEVGLILAGLDRS